MRRGRANAPGIKAHTIRAPPNRATARRLLMRSIMFKNSIVWHCLRLLVLLTGLGAVGAATAVSSVAPRKPLRAAVEDAGGARVIVKYKALGSLMRSVDRGEPLPKGPQQAGVMSRRLGLVLQDGRIVGHRIQVLRGGTDISSVALAARLAADDEVEYAVPDLRRYPLAVPNDPLYAGGGSAAPVAGQWYLRAPDSNFVSAINAVGAWNLTTGSAAIVVADLDTGVLFSHPDLVNKLYPGYDFITDTGDSADGNGRDSDATDPGDWTTAGQCETGSDATESSWHGTQTAGLIGAQTNNGIGMASVGRDVMLLPVRVLGKCGGTDSDIIAGMLWAGGLSSNPVVNAHPARVINMSLGGSGACSAAYRDAVSRLTAAGVVVVASAGNDEGLAVGSPANCPGVIAVGGVRNVGTKVGFSSLGAEVAISAPAGNCVNASGTCLYPILTTTNAGTRSATTNAYSDGTNISVGTSFSSPLVAGTAALMMSLNPALTPAQVRSLLQGSARPFPTTSIDTSVAQCRAPSSAVQDECLCTTSTCGAGMLDASAAVAAAAGSATPTVRVTPGATSVVAGTTVAFDGSMSMAAGGRSISSYRWAITSGSGIAVISGSATAATVQVVTSGAGSFTLQLTVTDSAGLQASASTTVAVNAPAAPVVQLLASASAVPAGGTVMFDGTGSTTAAGLTVAAYRWSITGGAALAAITSPPSAASVNVATVANASGSFTIMLTVTDSLGQQSSASRSVAVTGVTPIASLAASTLSAVIGSSVGFDATASTAPVGRSLVDYQWAIVSGSAIASFSGSVSGPTVSVLTSGAGSFTLQLTVTDSGGSQDVRTTTVSVAAAGAVTASSGGGAASGAWLLGLSLAVLVLFVGTPRRRSAGLG